MVFTAKKGVGVQGGSWYLWNALWQSLYFELALLKFRTLYAKLSKTKQDYLKLVLEFCFMSFRIRWSA